MTGWKRIPARNAPTVEKNVDYLRLPPARMFFFPLANPYLILIEGTSPYLSIRNV
jgi:hypothetical protein